MFRTLRSILPFLSLIAACDVQSAVVSGRVTARGVPIQRALIRFITPDRIAAGESVTDTTGSFSITLEPWREVDLHVTAEGFESSVTSLVEQPSFSLTIDLKSVKTVEVREEIVVSAQTVARRITESSASVATLSSEDLARSAAPALDEVLRQVPGFTLFRRTGSRTANPTAQGVSLRGVGASGTSRALVLVDGFPLNDPFGGWIYWGRIPRLELEQVAVIRGGGSDLHGNAAMGGVIDVTTRIDDGLLVEVAAGTLETRRAAAFFRTSRQQASFGFSGETFETIGYTPIIASSRGTIDQPAGSQHTSIRLTGTLQPTPATNVLVRGAWYDEQRQNGTLLQTNATTQHSFDFRLERLARTSLLELRAWTSTQDYTQSFTTPAADRQSERISRLQSVPSRAAGLITTWSAVAAEHSLLVTAELREVEGSSNEVIPTTRPLVMVRNGGTQQVAALAIEDLWSLTARLTMVAGLRYDHILNRPTVDSMNGPSPATSEGRHEALSPRLAMTYRHSPRLSMRASAYQAFRAATLNELYRPFRVGDVLTLANDGLEPERLTGVELGAQLHGPLTGRLTLFQTTTDDAIGNFTLSTTPALITRRRQNLATTRSRGIELELERNLSPGLRLSTGYLLVDAEITEDAEGMSEGRTLPQTPRNQLSTTVTFSPTRNSSISLFSRWSSSQFDDDRNQFQLDSATLFDVSFRSVLTRTVELVASVENLTDERYEVSRTQLQSLGSPRSWEIGFRFRD